MGVAWGGVKTKVQCEATWQLCLLFDFEQAEMGNARWCRGSCSMLKSQAEPMEVRRLCELEGRREAGASRCLLCLYVQLTVWKLLICISA